MFSILFFRVRLSYFVRCGYDYINRERGARALVCLKLVVVSPSNNASLLTTGRHTLEAHTHTHITHTHSFTQPIRASMLEIIGAIRLEPYHHHPPSPPPPQPATNLISTATDKNRTRQRSFPWFVYSKFSVFFQSMRVFRVWHLQHTDFGIE